MARLLSGLILLVLLVAKTGWSRDGTLPNWEQEIRSAAELLSQGRSVEAHGLLRRVLVRLERAEPDGARVIVTLNNLGNAAQALGRYDEADGYYGRAIRSCERNARCRKESLARMMGNLSSLYIETRRYDDAEKAQRRTLAILGRDSDPAERARQEEIAASIAWARKRPSDAIAWNQDALGSWTKVLGPTHPRIAAVLNNLGVAFLQKKDIPRAESYLLRAVAMWEITSGPDHAGLVEPLLNLTRLYIQMREPDKAGARLSRGLTIAERTYGALHRLVGSLLIERADLLRQQGMTAKAQEDARRGREILDRSKRELGRTFTVDVGQLVLNR